MRIDAGILPDSVRFFHEPDAFTEQALYHTPHVGVYHCDSQYNFSRAGETCLLCVTASRKLLHLPAC